MPPKNNPQSERRQALDAAIAALDEQRRKYQGAIIDKGSPAVNEIWKKQIGILNRFIRILSDMREEGPLL